MAVHTSTQHIKKRRKPKKSRELSKQAAKFPIVINCPRAWRKKAGKMTVPFENALGMGEQQSLGSTRYSCTNHATVGVNFKPKF